MGALDGGDDGLVIVRRLVAEAAEKIKSGGCLALELHSGHPSQLAPELERNNFRDLNILRDYSGHERFVITIHG
jgi:release factor glutamine methyltransferase